MMMMRAVKTMEKKRKSATTRCVGRVEQMMARMSSGFAVIVVSDGTMGNVSRSHLLELSISSTTNAQIAATRGQEHSMQDAALVRPGCEASARSLMSADMA
ncbi:hypothetical protein PR202_gb01268 [Eleusine coracana subsp. coracana]|uniref:Uncharacterized protein n=1 Tax=Eleusine coracana subsp. coracana TaxID=191504 RepID=A0AAV5DW60_ELECO|nr:hypothetical protein PR202_gb01268 [Eleusine coracana subsp. coracana]